MYNVARVLYSRDVTAGIRQIILRPLPLYLHRVCERSMSKGVRLPYSHYIEYIIMYKKVVEGNVDKI